MFKIDSFVTPLVTTTKNFNDIVIKDEKLRKSVNSFIDAQVACTNSMLAATNSLTAALYDSVKAYDPVKTFSTTK